MRVKTILCAALLILFFFRGTGQEVSSGLHICMDTLVYYQKVNENERHRLIDLKKLIPDLVLDIRYAGTNNFNKEPFYSEAAAFLRLPAALALARVQQELKQKGLSLIIYDAYRPYSVTCAIYNKVKDTNYAAPPWTGSRHNRACAIDLSMVRISDGKELSMPTPFDEFSPKASPTYANLPDSVKANRDFLINLMAKYGFSVYSSEWWHFDYKDWKEFPLMDLSFDQLRRPILTGNVGKYIDKYLYITLQLMISTGIPASVMLGIAIHETGACTSRNCKLLNNHFGMKAPKRYRIPGTKSITAYKTYESGEESYRQFTEMIQKRKYYPGLKGNMNYKAWIKAIGLSGYARAHSSWKTKIYHFISNYQLQQLDAG